jgi:hypothetical protein
MKPHKAFLFLILLACASLSSCYHQIGTGSGGGGGGGNGTSLLNITVTSTPSQTFSLVNFGLQITTLGVTNTAGIVTTVISDPLIPPAELVRLQSDSHYLGASHIAAGAYTNVIIHYSQPAGSFYNSTNATLLGCAPATVCAIPPTTPGFVGGGITIPFSFTVTGATGSGIDINIDLSKALTTSAGMTFDLTQTGAVKTTLLPRSGQLANSLDSLENYTGSVTAASTTSVTVAPFTSVGEPRIFKLASNVVFNDPFSICPQPPTANCLAVDQNVSVDGVINSDATFTAYEVEFLDLAPTVHEFEGIIIAPPASGQFQMLITNILGGLFNPSVPIFPGQTVVVSLNSNATFFVDPKNLGISDSHLGFMGPSDLVQGQNVMIKVLKQSTGNPPITITSDRVILRYSSMGGIVNGAASGNNFTFSSVSPFFTGLQSPFIPLVQTVPNATTYDGVTSLSGLAIPANVSVRALYLNPTSGASPVIIAAKVRQH